ncbi:MAG TPA: tyrosine-type recombinase/integrase [Chitinophagales bacterium]|nr:tyrosine-type recombinase/integrase [Chitinophagales bacterium]
MDLRSFLQYLQYEKRYSKLTVTAYENDLLQFSQFLKKTYELENLLATRHIYVRSWLASLMEGGTGARSINRKLSALKTFFKFHMKNGAIDYNPLAKIIAPKIPKRLPVFIQKSQTALLWQHVEFGEGFSGFRNQVIFELFYATGIRRAELIQLTDQSFDFYNLTIKVLGKGNKERMIPFNPQLKTVLKDYISLRNKTFHSTNFPVFIVSDAGEEMNPRKIYSIVHDLLQQVTTIDKKSPHVLRHTFATHLLNNGAEIHAIKELLGHSSLAATQVYTHNTIDKLKDIYKKAHPKA